VATLSQSLKRFRHSLERQPCHRRVYQSDAHFPSTGACCGPVRAVTHASAPLLALPRHGAHERDTLSVKTSCTNSRSDVWLGRKSMSFETASKHPRAALFEARALAGPRSRRKDKRRVPQQCPKRGSGEAADCVSRTQWLRLAHVFRGSSEIERESSSNRPSVGCRPSADRARSHKLRS
jgi:hypothetical protein